MEKNSKKWFNPRCYSHAIALATLVTFVLWGILFFLGFFEARRDTLMFFGFAATTTSILVAVLQSIKVHDWNRRQAAQSALKEFREKTKPHIEKLDEAFNYYLRDESSPITKEEIHAKICRKGSDGKFIRCDKSDKIEIDPEKSDLAKSIREYLNLYEDIASGVHQGVYDKEVVADLMASSFIKVANLFGPYIKHFNEDMYPASRNRIWINVKTLGEDLRKKYREDKKAVERDKTG